MFYTPRDLYQRSRTDDTWWRSGPWPSYTLRVGSDGRLHLEYMVEAPGGYGMVPASIDLTDHIRQVIREVAAEALAAHAKPADTRQQR
jgi:hypothetical protein